MAAYVVVIIHKIKDETAFAEYRKFAEGAINKHGGSAVVRPAAPVTLDGSGDNPRFITMLTFPSTQAAENWRNDPELKDIHALRNKAIDATIYAF